MTTTTLRGIYIEPGPDPTIHMEGSPLRGLVTFTMADKVSSAHCFSGLDALRALARLLAD